MLCVVEEFQLVVKNWEVMGYWFEGDWHARGG
jgi:hypothetical protein